MAKYLKTLICLGGWAWSMAQASVVDGANCIAPAKPDGGFDITCQLLRDALQKSRTSKTPLTIAYQPGGVGAMAFNTTVKQRPADKKVVVAFSSGTLLNLAQGRFGAYRADDVRWLAALGMDYGVVAVRRDAPFTNLKSLLAALKDSPQRIAFGSSGTLGSQDWIKSALLAQAAGISHKQMRVVAFEGGGDALAALRRGHIQVLAGDTAEVHRQMKRSGDLRVLAVLSEHRLPGPWASTPTAKEQGHNITWSAMRGIYTGPGVTEADQREWIEAIKRASTHTAYNKLLQESGLQPGLVTGADLDTLVETQIKAYKTLTQSFGIAPLVP